MAKFCRDGADNRNISTPQLLIKIILYKQRQHRTQPQKSSGIYTDGTYTGTPVNAYYGTVQVEATVQNGALADVTFLQYPSDRSTSHMINNKAMPILTKEALQIQSAQVDGVSGATDTSQAFKQSLASALTQAKILKVSFVDTFLNKITMYRLVLYYLVALFAIALLFGFFGIIPISPANLAFSTLTHSGSLLGHQRTFRKNFQRRNKC